MYLPQHFRERRLAVLQEFIERHPLGILVTVVGSVPVANEPGDFIRAMLRAIVGFEIEVTELAGKFTASQNRSAMDRDGVRDVLGEAGSGDLDELVRDPG